MLHPQARAFLDLLVANRVPPTHALTPAQARTFQRERRAVTQPDPPEVGSVQELACDGPHGPIELRLYRPQRAATASGAALPVLIYYHGGGWTIGSVVVYDTLCRQLSNASGCAVLSVGYRLAPEFRFPCAVDDAWAAARWCHQEAATLGLDPQRIAVGGDSAGGNLAAVVAILARDAGDLPLRHQLLIYPATDQRAQYPSRTANGQGYLLTSETMAYFHDHYIDDRRHDLDWRASPLLHTELSRLPPALVLTAGFDPLRDEGLAYAEALTAAGNRCAQVCYERQIHNFIVMGRVIDEAESAIQLCAASVRAALLA